MTILQRIFGFKSVATHHIVGRGEVKVLNVPYEALQWCGHARIDGRKRRIVSVERGLGTGGKQVGPIGVVVAPL